MRYVYPNDSYYLRRRRREVMTSFMPSMNKIKLPKPGLRNTKTALSVCFCILLYELIGKPNPLFACSAAIICMKETVHYSYQKGVDRLAGTLLGGIVGLVFLLIKNHLALLHTEAIVVFCKTNFPVCAKWFLQRPRQGILRVVTFHQ